MVVVLALSTFVSTLLGGRDQFTTDVAAVGADVHWTSLRYFWLATFQLR